MAKARDPTRRLLLRRAAGALPLLGAGLPLALPPAPALAVPAAPAGELLSPPDRRLLNRYSSWLHTERRLLQFELHPGLGEEAQRWVMCDAAVSLFRFPALPTSPDKWSSPSPPARAVPLLWALGLLEGPS